MSAFAYKRPSTLADALEALRDPGALPLAGGTDFVTMQTSGTIVPEVVVDLKGVDTLAALALDDGGAKVGSAVTMRRLGAVSDPAIAALADGASIVGGALTRNRATVGGNVCRSSPAGDTLPGLLVLGARAQIASAAGERSVGLEDFFAGPGRNVLEPDELLVGIELKGGRGGSAYERLTYRRWMDLAVVGVGVWLDVGSDGLCSDASVAFGGAARTPRLVPGAAQALIGTDLGPDALDRAAAAVRCAAEPIDDVRGSVSHRLRGLGVLVRRVALRAAGRARGSGS